MSVLHTSTSYNVGFGISPFSAPPTRSSSSTHCRHVAFAASAEPFEKSIEIMRKFSEQHYDDKTAEVDQGFWNCPCVPMRERKECNCWRRIDYFFGGEQRNNC
nr:ferredoxin-thioredoxin reductase catalytic chain, chloroplastic [Ipomoea batatas]